MIRNVCLTQHSVCAAQRRVYSRLIVTPGVWTSCDVTVTLLHYSCIDINASVVRRRDSVLTLLYGPCGAFMGISVRRVNVLVVSLV